MNKIHDTTFTQLLSVVRFAKELSWDFNGRSFVKYCGKKERDFCGFDDMQRCHNMGTLVYDDNTELEPLYATPCNDQGKFLVVSPVQFCDALGAKLVGRSKLQYNKKLKCFVAQCLLVEALDL